MKNKYVTIVVIIAITLSLWWNLYQFIKIKWVHENNQQLKTQIKSANDDIQKLKKIVQTETCMKLYNNFKNNYSNQDSGSFYFKETETLNIFYSEIEKDCFVWYKVYEQFIMKDDTNLMDFIEFYSWNTRYQAQTIYYIDRLSNQTKYFEKLADDLWWLSLEYSNKINSLK